MSALTLQQLRVLVAVVEHHSYTQGAQALFLSQSAASQHVHALEQTFGTALVRRTSGSVVPTQAGEGLVRYARDILRLADDAERYVARCRDGQAGRLVLGASGSAVYLVPALVSAFRAARPGMEVTLQVLSREALIEALAGGALDLGLLGGPLSPQTDERLKTLPLCPDRLLLVASPSDAILPAAGLAPLPPPRLEQLPFAVTLDALDGLSAASAAFSSGGLGLTPTARALAPSWQVVERWAMALGVQVSPNLLLAGVEAVKKAVEAGLALAFLSAWAVEREVALGTLRVVPLDAPPLLREYHLAVRPGGRDEEAIRAFIEFAPAHLRAHLPAALVEQPARPRGLEPNSAAARG